MFQLLKQIVAAAARDSLRSDMAPGVSPCRIEVSSVPGDPTRLTVRYVLCTFDAPSKRPLFMRDVGAPFAIEEIRTAVDVRWVAGGSNPSASRNHLLVLKKGQRWDGMVVEMTMRAGGGVSVLEAGGISLPDALPEVLTVTTEAEQPDLCIDEVLRAKATGIPGREKDAFLQCVLAGHSATKVEPPSQHPVWIAGRLASEWQIPEQERAARLISRIVEFHTVQFGVESNATTVLAPDESSWHARGALLALNGLQSLGVGTSLDPEDVMLGSRLAGIWWGAGCRITGKLGRELEAGIRGAVGMLWADGVEGIYRKGVYAEWTRLASHSTARDFWAGRSGGFRHGLHARLTLALYEALLHDPSVGNALKSLTRESWGHHVPARRVLERLAHAGVEFGRV